MSYKLITGTFHIVGFMPDGDSLRFKPDTRDGLKLLNAMGAEAKGKSGTYQLRFDAIDALETHYLHKHQYWLLAEAAANRLLELMGFQDVVFGKAEVVDVRKDGLPGYILTRRIDNKKYKRPVAFVFPGKSPRPTNADTFIDENWVNRSVNATLIREGLAYPALYSELPWDLRDYFIGLVATARKSSKSTIWKRDKSTEWTSISLAKLEDLAIWPKLYRRLISFLNNGARSLKGFETWMRADIDRDDQLIILPEARRGNFHDVLDFSRLNQNKIRMLYRPEEITVVEDIVREDISEPSRPDWSIQPAHLKASKFSKKHMMSLVSKR